MLNHVCIMGRLTRDPELRRTGSGLAVASFSVAVERDYPNQQTGEREVDFIDCVAWRQTGEFVSKWFTKGSMIVVSGRLQMRKWVDKDGKNRTTAEIVADNVYFGESKKDRDNREKMTNIGVENSTYTGEFSNYAPKYSAPTGNVYPTPYGTPNYGAYGAPVKPAVSDWALLDDDDAQLPF